MAITSSNDVLVKVKIDDSQHHKAMVQMGRDLGKVEREAKLVAKAHAHLTKSTLGLAKSTQRTSSAIEVSSASYMRMSAAVVAAAGALKGIDALLESGLKQTGVYNALPFAIDKTAESLAGLATNFSIAQAASTQASLGLNMSEKEFRNMAEAAAIAGQKMGIDVNQALQDIIKGLGRASPMILDNLGITIKVGEANEAYAKALGKAVSELTDAEKKTAFTTKTMEKLNEIAESGTLVNHGLGASWKQLKTNISNATDAAARWISTWSPQAHKAYHATEAKLLAREAAARRKGYQEFVDSQAALVAERKKTADALAKVEEKAAKKRTKARSNAARKHAAAMSALGPAGPGGAAGAQAVGGLGQMSDSDLSDFDTGDGGIAKQDGPLVATQIVQDAQQKAFVAKMAQDEQMRQSNAALNQSYKDLAAGGLASFAGGMASAIDAAVSGQQSFGAAMQSMVNATLRGVAKQATVKALMEAAEAIASLAVWDLRGAALHGTAAAKFGAIGAIALGASAAVGSPSSSAGRGTSGVARTAGGSIPRSSNGSAGSKREQGPVIVNIHYDRSDPHAMRMAAAKIRASMSANTAKVMA